MSTEKKTRVEGLEFWNKVEKTDANYVKTYPRQGRSITTPNPMYQVRTATEQWGPVGGTWWWEVEHSIVGDMFLARVALHHPMGENPVVQYGCWHFTGNKPDTDAPKKAVTDGLTKCLSYLGFNADIFLGRWDDVKYVTERQAEAASKVHPLATEPQIARIQELAAEVYGEGAATYLAEQLKLRGLNRLEAMPEERAHKWIGYLDTQLKTRAQAPDPLPLNTEKEVAHA